MMIDLEGVGHPFPRSTLVLDPTPDPAYTPQMRSTTILRVSLFLLAPLVLASCSTIP